MSVLKRATRAEWEAVPVEHRYIEDGELYVDFTAETHPWALYLHARAEAIRWLAADEEPPERIVAAVNCDLGYVLDVLHKPGGA